MLAAVVLILHFAPALGNKIEVTMDVNRHPTKMILDTGAQTTVFRKQLGPAGKSIRVDGATGSSFAKVCEVVIAGQSVQALCGVDLPDAQEGLLGSDFLGRYSSMEVDYRNHIVKLVP